MIDTPFETHGGVTTLAEEEAFLSLLAKERRTTVTVIGHTVGGCPIRRISIGHYGAPASLFVGLQHGNEPAGREALLALARDLTFPTGELADYLNGHAVHLIPTVNADFLEQSRTNAAGFNINRDHVRLDTPEARAISPQLAIPGVQIVVDMHEHWDDTTDITVGTQGNLAVAAELRGVSQDLNSHLSAWLPAQGFTWQQYSFAATPGTLRNHLGMRGKAGLLVETSALSQSLGTRLDQHRTTAVGVLGWHKDNRAAVETAIDASAAWHIAEGQAQAPFLMNPPGVTLDPAPLYYTLTNAQHGRIAPHRHSFGIASEPHRYGWKVPMSQPARAMIPFVMDAAAEAPDPEGDIHPVIIATRGEPPELMEAAGASKWGPLHSGGYDMPVTAVDLYTADGMVAVWRP